jgi:hypothetical protein
MTLKKDDVEADVVGCMVPMQEVMSQHGHRPASAEELTLPGLT